MNSYKVRPVHLRQVEHDEARPPATRPLVITPAIVRSDAALHRVAARALGPLVIPLARLGPLVTSPGGGGGGVVAQSELEVAYLW